MFKKAQRFGGGFFDLKELAADKPTLVLFRVKEFHPVEKATGFEGWNFPVMADALVCDGPRKGEVHLEERFIGAITSTLRGVQNARKHKGETPQEPVNEVGDLILARVDVMNKGQNNAAAVGNVPSDADGEAAEAFYASLGDENAWVPKETDVQAQREEAGVSAGGKRGLPWG